MSHAVMHGSPTKAQLYLDGVMAELVAETGQQNDRFSLAKIIFKCLRDHPQDIRQIEDSSDTVDTNDALLKRGVATALALQAAGVRPGDMVILIGRNHLELSGAYFGSLFAGVMLFPLHVGMTAYELGHFFAMSTPAAIFTESEDLPQIKKTLEGSDQNPKIIVFGQNSGCYQSFAQFTSGFDDSTKVFRPADSEADDAVLVLSTSGSSGLPKAVLLTNRGLIAQLPSLWFYHDSFPKPTNLYLNGATAGWITHTLAMTATTVYRVPMLTTAARTGGPAVMKKMIRQYKPTCSVLATYAAASLLSDPDIQPGDLSCFELIYVGGSSVTDHLLGGLRRVLRPDACAIVMYGMTEIHGPAIQQRPGASNNSLGTAFNIGILKIVDEQGNTLGPNTPGELCYKSNDCIFKGYLKDQKATKETLTEDGWLKTGDMVYINDREEVFFVDRIKFLIRSGSGVDAYNVYPSEVENVISKLEEVQSVAVCGVERGPAALVVPRPGHNLKPQQVHDAANSALSDMKRLRGGVAFTSSVPLLLNGKIDRKKLQAFFQDISQDQIHYSTKI